MLGCSAPADTDTKEPVVDEPVVDTEPAAPVVDDTDPGDASLWVNLRLNGFEPLPEFDPDGVVKGRIISDVFTYEQVTMTLTSDLEGALPVPATIGDDGRFDISTATWRAGVHLLTLSATDPQGNEATFELEVPICRWPALEEFNTSVAGAGWTTYGDAHWDPGGWLEVTGNAGSRSGAIYRTSQKINPGDFRIEFSIATGGGGNTGADGFAVNVIDAQDVAELTTIVEAASNGGCLAYGTDSHCGDLRIEGFHVEMDTWYNSETLLNDPTQENHLAIALDGDPGNYIWWYAVPSLEDLVWRDIMVEAIGQRLRLEMDGVVLLDQVIPGFSFDGGYIGVSGSTGWAYNYHRFDNLQLYDRCLVPGT